MQTRNKDSHKKNELRDAKYFDDQKTLRNPSCSNARKCIFHFSQHTQTYLDANRLRLHMNRETRWRLPRTGKRTFVYLVQTSWRSGYVFWSLENSGKGLDFCSTSYFCFLSLSLRDLFSFAPLAVSSGGVAANSEVFETTFVRFSLWKALWNFKHFVKGFSRRRYWKSVA